MTTILGILILACILSVVATMLMMRLAIRFGVLDRPDVTRHFHGRPIPKMGGVAVFLAFAIPLMLLMHMEHITLLSNLILSQVLKVGGLLAGGAMVLIVGLVDDIFDLKPRWKILWQVLIAAVAYYAGFRITALTFPFVGVFDMGAFAFPVTIMWFLVCMNAVNLLDGHDGLAAGACLFVGLTLMLVSINTHNTLGAVLMASFAGSVLGFLFFNFPPAKIFLGDSGSLLLGFLVAGLSLVGATMKAETAFSLLIPVVALGLPFFDTLYAIMRRVYARMPISMGDRGHIHHILSRMGYSSRRVVLILYAVTLGLCALAFVVTVMRNEVVLIIILVLVVVAFVGVRIFSGITPEKMLDRYIGDRAQRSRVLKSRMSLENALDRIMLAGSIEEAWRICGEILSEVGVSCAGLSYRKNGKRTDLKWPVQCGQGAEAEKSTQWWRLSLPFTAVDAEGRIEVGFEESGHSLAAIPEFTGLMERIRTIIIHLIERLPDSGLDESTLNETTARDGAGLQAEEVPDSFITRALRHERRYGIIHSIAGFAGRFMPRLWRSIGPVITNDMIQKWLSGQGPHILNLGGGSNCIEGCLTVAVDPGAEVYLDVTKPFPIPSEVVDGIFCEEVVEHISADDARDMLLECLRIMKPGGVIRLVTPDLDYLLSNASCGGEGEQRINDAFLMHEHRRLYSRNSLKLLLEECGFADLKHSRYRSADSELGHLDSHANRFSHAPEMSQYVEARKAR